MKEIKQGNKAVRFYNDNNAYYGQYYKDEFQVLSDKVCYTERQRNNFLKKCGL